MLFGIWWLGIRRVVEHALGGSTGKLPLFRETWWWNYEFKILYTENGHAAKLRRRNRDEGSLELVDRKSQ